MKICCLYFPTSSVGGIATNIASLRAEAGRRGDTFHALKCDNIKSHEFTITSKLQRIRGGDTFVDIDGYAPHHPSKAAYVAKKINENYDIVYLTQMCPHATKAYGNDPIFLPLLKGISKPIVGNIPDGYWDTYAHWGNLVAALCSRIIVATPPYRPNDLDNYPNIPIVYGYGFDPVELDTPRDAERSMVWISQWKAIKGIHNFLSYLPNVEGKQDLYSNGILYYQLRTEEKWKNAIGRDEFQGFSGSGRATFFGWQPLDVIRQVLSRAWFMPEFQGFGRPRNAAYQNGSINNTIKEALFYQCTPVIPSMTVKAYDMPVEAVRGVDSYEEAVVALNGDRAEKPELGKQWVLDKYHIAKIYDSFFQGLV
jgi:hypothetical protein